jgi:probable phosphoglycerate mutase
MTRILLVHHAEHSGPPDRLTGRATFGLNERGRHQAGALAQWLAHEAIDVVHTSPQKPARATAEAIAAACLIEPRMSTALDEIDYGRWTGQRFDELALDPDWQLWYREPTDIKTPAGETMQAVQCRFIDEISSLCRIMPKGTAVLVSHADPIKSALAYYLGAPLDHLQNFDVAPASISPVEITVGVARVHAINVGSECAEALACLAMTSATISCPSMEPQARISFPPL